MYSKLNQMKGITFLSKKNQSMINGKGPGGPGCQTDDDCPGAAICLLGGCYL